MQGKGKPNHRLETACDTRKTDTNTEKPAKGKKAKVCPKLPVLIPPATKKKKKHVLIFSFSGPYTPIPSTTNVKLEFFEILHE